MARQSGDKEREALDAKRAEELQDMFRHPGFAVYKELMTAVTQKAYSTLGEVNIKTPEGENDFYTSIAILKFFTFLNKAGENLITTVAALKHQKLQDLINQGARDD